MSTQEEVDEAVEGEACEDPQSSAADESMRHWLTNDAGFLWILACYMTVWATVHLSPHLFGVQPSVPWLVDFGAMLALASALTWGYGVDAMEAWQSRQGGS